jgi:hypothetical protein
MDAGADAREFRRLLVKPDVIAGLLQQNGGYRSSEAAANDRDGQPAWHCHGFV